MTVQKKISSFVRETVNHLGRCTLGIIMEEGALGKYLITTFIAMSLARHSRTLFQLESKGDFIVQLYFSPKEMPKR